MSRLFDATRIKTMAMGNRFVRSATWEGMAAPDGEVTPKLVELMVQLSRGGVGLIITSHAYVRPDGQAGLWQLGIHEDRLVKGLRGMTSAVHGEGGCIVAQVSHAGFFASPKMIGQTPFAVSEVEGFGKSPRKELTKEDIRSIVQDFGKAASSWRIRSQWAPCWKGGGWMRSR